MKSYKFIIAILAASSRFSCLLFDNSKKKVLVLDLLIIQSHVEPIFLLVLSESGPIIPEIEIAIVAVLIFNKPRDISFTTSSETAPCIDKVFGLTFNNEIFESFEYVTTEDSKKLDDPAMSVKYLDIKPPVQDSAVEIS
jgi:hypothetical protein